MGRIYSMSFDNVDLDIADGPIDFFELIAPTSGRGLLHEVHLDISSQLGDAAEEQLRWAIVTGNTSSGTGGTVGVEVPRSLGLPAATAVGETMNVTAVASAGTEAVHHRGAFNVRVGLQFIFTPEARIPWSANRLCVRLLAAVTSDDTKVSGTIVWEEED